MTSVCISVSTVPFSFLDRRCRLSLASERSNDGRISLARGLALHSYSSASGKKCSTTTYIHQHQTPAPTPTRHPFSPPLLPNLNLNLNLILNLILNLNLILKLILNLILILKLNLKLIFEFDFDSEFDFYHNPTIITIKPIIPKPLS